MIEAFLLVVLMYAVLTFVGWCVLAPADPDTRNTLLPAAPILGAGLIAAVSSTTTRWLSMPVSLIVIAVLLAGLVGLAVRRKRRFVRVERRTILLVLLCPVLTFAGAAVAALPTIWVDDYRPVDATVVVDQFYFASNASYLTDHSMLPGPYWNAEDWAGSATPSVGPVVDVIVNRLRYGQASVASAVSFVLGKDPSDTVTPISIMLLILVGPGVFVAATLLGMRRRPALVAVPVVTSSLYLTSQALEGKNDGLLGVSIALLALALSYAVTRNPRFFWPLVVAVAGLAATYPELVLVLVAPVTLLTVVGRRSQLLARLNVVAGAWALAAILTPWAWVWLAQSARIGGRFSQGSTPFENRRGLDLLRAVLGAVPAGEGGALTTLFSVAAVLCGLAVVVGLAWAVVRTPARGAAIGIVLALGVLEYSAIRSGSGNPEYRGAQLGVAFVLLFAAVGWDALTGERAAGVARFRALAASALAIVLACTFTLANVATAASHLPRERAAVQHVPSADLDEAVSWIREVGPANVSVVVPRFTDLIWLALDLRSEAGVGFPVVPAIYLGSFPRWDRKPDRYYLVGVGATVAGDATVVKRNSRYQLVELHEDGMILTPFQPTFYWARPTYMRGFPCARDGAQMLLLRGSSKPATFAIASLGKAAARTNLRLDIDGVPLATATKAAMVDGWNVQTYQAPRFRSAIINLSLTTEVQDTGSTALPVLFADRFHGGRLRADPGLTKSCLADRPDNMDGYDRDLTSLRGN